MHAVLVKVSISDFEGSVKELRETVVPRISQLPGFVAGYWDAIRRRKQRSIHARVRVGGGRSDSRGANRSKRS